MQDPDVLFFFFFLRGFLGAEPEAEAGCEV